MHQYDEINRKLMRLTLSRDLPKWKRSLETLFNAADSAMAVGLWIGRLDRASPRFGPTH